MIPPDVLDLVKLSVYAIAAAVAFHELTHFVFALGFGRQPSFAIEWRPLVGPLSVPMVFVDHDFRTPMHAAYGHVTPADIIIHAAPLLMGIWLAIWFVVSVGALPPLWLFLGWATYTLLGAPNDLSFRSVKIAA